MSDVSQDLTVEAVYEALGTVKDPCMVTGGHDLSILDLGLVYGVEAQEGGRVRVDMTLTEVGCIFTHRIFGDVYDAVEALPGWGEGGGGRAAPDTGLDSRTPQPEGQTRP